MVTLTAYLNIKRAIIIGKYTNYSLDIISNNHRRNYLIRFKHKSLTLYKAIYAENNLLLII